MDLTAQLRASLLAQSFPPPSTPFLTSLLTTRSPPPPLPSLLATAKARLLACDLTSSTSIDRAMLATLPASSSSSSSSSSSTTTTTTTITTITTTGIIISPVQSSPLQPSQAASRPTNQRDPVRPSVKSSIVCPTARPGPATRTLGPPPHATHPQGLRSGLPLALDLN